MSNGPNTKYYINCIKQRDKFTKKTWDRFIDFIQNDCIETHKNNKEVKCKIITQDLCEIDNKSKNNKRFNKNEKENCHSKKNI